MRSISISSAACLAIVSAASLLGGCAMDPSPAMSREAEAVTSTTPAIDIAALRAAAIADPRRPAEEVERDGLRKPMEMLEFMQARPGGRYADIRPEEGYFTRLLAPVVGETGKVYAFVPTRTAAREMPLAEGLATQYPNVVALTGALDSMTFPEPLDGMIMVQEYHDFHIPSFGVDVTKMNAAAFAALKPGGLYVVIDHAGAAGTGNTQVQTLHRIEGDFLRREVEAAGFVFDGASEVLANPEDTLTINVFDTVIRGKTQQFAYRFRKPG